MGEHPRDRAHTFIISADSAGFPSQADPKADLPHHTLLGAQIREPLTCCPVMADGRPLIRVGSGLIVGPRCLAVLCALCAVVLCAASRGRLR